MTRITIVLPTLEPGDLPAIYFADTDLEIAIERLVRARIEEGRLGPPPARTGGTS